VNTHRIIEAALEYVGRGWAVVPVKPRSKKPRPNEWTKFRIDHQEISKHFREADNIGLLLGEPSGGLVDVDLDCPEVLKLADAFLPATPLVHGRKGKPASHRWYRVSRPPEKTQKFCDLDGASLVELRSTGGQTVVPPSIHESGELITWEGTGEPAEVDSQTLAQAVSRLAAAALLARHWPLPGSRHDVALALAGLLLCSKWSKEDSAEFVRAVALAAHDEEAPERAHDVLSTAKAIALGLKTTGGKTLASIIGKKVVARVHSWLNLSRVTSVPITLTSDTDTALSAAIRDVALDRETALFDKRRDVARLVQRGLSARGNFLRTNDGRAFFFHTQERRLYDIDQTPFRHLLTQISGLVATESFFVFTLSMLQANTNREARRVNVRTFSYFDLRRGLLAVSDGAAGIWVRERGGDWQLCNNGDDDLLFLTDPQAKALVPDFSKDGRALQWFLSQFMFANSPLTAEDYRTLMLVCVLQQLFPPLRQTRMIPAFLGPQGSGKTTAMRLLGRLFVGPEFEVTGLQREREDAFIAAVCNRIVVGLDNADSKIPFLSDALARYATGHRYQLRRLYTTNEEVSFSPRAILMISSRDPRFNRPDVAERLLPFHFDRPENYKPELEIFEELERQRSSVMGALLVRAGNIADSLPEHPAKPTRFRMADFASFGERVCASLKESSEWVQLLDRLEKAQTEFASDGDGVVDALRVLLIRERVEGISIGDLFRMCRDVATSHGFLFPKSCQAFGRRLSSMRRVIEIELGVRFQESHGHRRERMLSIVPRHGYEGDVGDDSGRKAPKEEIREPV
jgi:hypothetical protein